MKKALIILLLTVLFPLGSKAQYWTSGGEIIFSWANYKDSTTQLTGPPRFTIFLHLNYKYNLDLGKHIGLAAGIGMRNMGFITRNETFTRPGTGEVAVKYEKIKRRSYTIGVPVMLKLGNMKKDRFLAIGAEYEWLFHFKEKAFANGEKKKRKAFNSDETARFLPSVFVGLQLSDFGMLKFQYYLDDFLNKDYVDNTGYKPYADTQSQMMMISWLGNVRMKKYKKAGIGEKRRKDELNAFNQLTKGITIKY